MGEVIVVEDVPDIPSGFRLAKIVEVEPYTGKFEPALKVYFMVKKGQVAEGPITGMFPMKATTRNKTGVLIKAALGRCEVGQKYNSDQLVNRYLWVEVERKETNDGIFSRVKRAMWPPPNAAVVETPAQAPKADPKFEDWGAGAKAPDSDMPF